MVGCFQGCSLTLLLLSAYLLSPGCTRHSKLTFPSQARPFLIDVLFNYAHVCLCVCICVCAMPQEVRRAHCPVSRLCCAVPVGTEPVLKPVPLEADLMFYGWCDSVQTHQKQSKVTFEFSLSLSKQTKQR